MMSVRIAQVFALAGHRALYPTAPVSSSTTAG